MFNTFFYVNLLFAVCQGEKYDIALVIDESGSIRGPTFQDAWIDTWQDNWWEIRQFLVKLLSTLTIGPSFSQIGAVRFANQAEVGVLFSSHDKILRIPAHGRYKLYPKKV